VDPITLCATLCAFLPLQLIESRDRWLGGSQRQRKRDVLSLVIALVMTPGSDDSGRQADIFTTYLSNAPHAVVRSSFYAWFTESFALLMMTLLDDAIEKVKALEPVLDGALAGWKDWRAVDSETITLRPALRWIFPAPKGAGIKGGWRSSSDLLPCRAARSPAPPERDVTRGDGVTSRASD